MRDYFGRDPAVVELPDAAVARDLLDAIDARWGAGLPAYLWDRENRRFKGPVLLVIDKKAVQDETAPLTNDMEIRLMRAIAGG